MTIPQLPFSVEEEYYRKISKIESGDNPKAKNPHSTASGRFQFIKSTWEGLGYNWKDVFNDSLQWEAIKKFTAQNAKSLAQAGCAINHATLYGSHFLGVAGFLKIMRATPTAPIESVTTPGQRKANPTILKGTVKDFTDWLEKKTGDDYRKRYDVAATGGELPTKPIVVEPRPEMSKKSPLGAIFFGLLVLAVAAVIYFTLGK